MIWMKTYFLYCSVRLGVMIISVFSFITCFIPSILFLVMGLKILDPILRLFNEDPYFTGHFLVKFLSDKVRNDSTDFKVVIQLFYYGHMTACVLAFYGSLKLKKYLLLPMISFELWRFLSFLSFHILFMTVVKNYVNLGLLIIITIAGGFFILFLGYNWATCVGLYKIINLINSERYKNIYGDDPFNPLIPKTNELILATDTVRVVITPKLHDTDEQQKSKNPLYDANKNYPPQPENIISVLPVGYFENIANAKRNNAKWKQSHWPTTSVKTPPTVERYSPTSEGFSTLRRHNRNDSYEVNYNDWQRSEVAPAVTARNKQNTLGSIWK